MAKRTIVFTFDIDTDDYDDDEFGEDPEDTGPRDFIDLAIEMLRGETDFPEEGGTVTCDGVSLLFNET